MCRNDNPPAASDAVAQGENYASAYISAPQATKSQGENYARAYKTQAENDEIYAPAYKSTESDKQIYAHAYKSAASDAAADNKIYAHAYITGAKEKQETPANTLSQGFREFLKQYPAVAAEEIPKRVWEEVISGESLVNAYTRYENEQLRRAVQTARDELNARKKSLPGAQSVGKLTRTDPFIEGFLAVN